jgi:hypothetical protein
MRKFGLSVVLTGALVSPAMACDLCSIYAATRAGGEAGKGFYGGVAEQFTHFGTLQDGGHEIPNDGEFIDSSVAQVFAGYFFNDRFNVQFNLPVIHRSFGSDTGHGSTSGIGDVSLIGNYAVWRKRDVDYTFDWTLLGGVKFPTGDSSLLNSPNFASGIAGHDLALGSGSYDGVVGTGAFARWKRAFFTANLQYGIRGEGDFEHQYANDLTWAGGPGVYLALTDDYTLALQGIVSGEYKGPDTFAGVDDEDSAVTIVYLGPQINLTWSDKLSFQAGVDVPVSRYNTGVQVVPDYRVHAALTWHF